MNCKEVQTTLDSLKGDEILSTPLLWSMEEHFDTCDPCAKKVLSKYTSSLFGLIRIE